MIAVVGGYGQGLTMRVSRSPEAGETIAGGVLSMDHGGKGSNQAVAVRRLGVDSSIVTALGEDDAALAARSLWAEEGVTDRAVVIPGVCTMTGFILVEPSGENRICIADGALADLRPEHLDGQLTDLTAEDILLVSLEIPLESAALALRIAQGRGARTILNPAPANAGSATLLSNTDVATPNRSELAVLSGLPEPTGLDEVAACCAALRARTGYTGELIITLGAEGAYVDDGDHALIEPIPVPEVVDTTGAGDAYSAALAVALHEGSSVREAAHFAAAAGALAVQQEQAIPSLPSRADVDRLNESRASSR